MNSSHDYLICSRLIWDFFRANSCVSDLVLHWLLLVSCNSTILTALEIEDVALDGREGAIIGNIEASRDLLLLLLTVHIDLNLRPLDRSRINTWSLLDILSPTIAIAGIGASSHHLAGAVKLFGSRDYLHSLIEHSGVIALRG